MLALMCAVLLTDAEPATEPFLGSGGINLAVVQGIHGAIIGSAVWFSATSNTHENLGTAEAFAIGIPLAYIAGGIVAGHFARPTPAVAYESAILAWAGFFAGMALGDFYISTREGNFNPNWSYPTRIIAGAFGHLVGALIPLLPVGRDPPGWHSAAILGAAAIGSAVIIIVVATDQTGGPGGLGSLTKTPALLAPLLLGATVSVALRAFFPEQPVQLVPAPLPDGVGLFLSLPVH